MVVAKTMAGLHQMEHFIQCARVPDGAEDASAIGHLNSNADSLLQMPLGISLLSGISEPSRGVSRVTPH